MTQSAIQGVEATPLNGACEICTLSDIEAAIRFLANIKAPQPLMPRHS